MDIFSFLNNNQDDFLLAIENRMTETMRRAKTEAEEVLRQTSNSIKSKNAFNQVLSAEFIRILQELRKGGGNGFI
jgi:hypothetical protein